VNYGKQEIKKYQADKVHGESGEKKDEDPTNRRCRVFHPADPLDGSSADNQFLGTFSAGPHCRAAACFAYIIQAVRRWVAALHFKK
jgi:hypothetical protein